MGENSEHIVEHFYGWLIKGWNGEDLEDETLVFHKAHGAAEASRLFRLGIDRMEIISLHRSDTKESHTLEDALEIFKP